MSDQETWRDWVKRWLGPLWWRAMRYLVCSWRGHDYQEWQWCQLCGYYDKGEWVGDA